MDKIYVGIILIILLLLSYYVSPLFLIGIIPIVFIGTKNVIGGDIFGWQCWNPTAIKGQRCIESSNGSFNDKYRCENNCHYQIELVENDIGKTYQINFPIPIQFLQELSTTRKDDFANFLDNQTRINRIARYCNNDNGNNTIWDVLLTDFPTNISISVTRDLVIQLRNRVTKLLDHYINTCQLILTDVLKHKLKVADMSTKFIDYYSLAATPKSKIDGQDVIDFYLIARNMFEQNKSEWYDILSYHNRENVSDIDQVNLDHYISVSAETQYYANEELMTKLENQFPTIGESLHPKYDDEMINDFKDAIENDNKMIIIPITLKLDVGGHANILIYNKINNTVFHFEPHVISGHYSVDAMKNYVTEFFKIHLDISPEFISLGSLYACPAKFEYKISDGKSLHLQGNDQLCQTWVKLAMLLYAYNPDVPIKAIFNELSYRHALRYLIQFLYYIEQKSSPYFTPENSTSTRDFSLGNITSKNIEELVKIQ